MRKLIFILVIFIHNSVLSQDLLYDVGIISGATSMQSDYGERGHFGSSYANMGFGIGGVYYVSYDNFRKQWNDRTTFLKEHLRARLELSFMKTNLIQRGKYTQGNPSFTQYYNSMKGTSNTINYGLQIEYTLFNMSDRKKIDPYVSFGFLGNSNSPKLISALGDIETDSNLIPSVYDDGVFLDKKNSTSLTIGMGARLKPKEFYNKSIYLLDFRWQRFNSDFIDGLSPTLDANKHNDWLLYLSIGYIYNLN
ncbi:MAG: hypothetical protein V3U80_00965 [Flavobacteriaceae bacterium]